MSIERYARLLYAALEVQQLEHRKKKLLDVIADNITVRELTTKAFDKDTATKALLLTEGLKIEEALYVKAKAFYGEVEICLHCEPSQGDQVMKAILKEIPTRNIIE